METITPEQKAKELVEKFMPFLNYWEDVPKDSSFNRLAIRKIGIDRLKAKECALIAVDEILISFNSFMDSRRNFRHELEIDAERFWEKVKSEIKKL